MGNVFKPWYWKIDENGNRVRVQTRRWYVRWQVAGKTKKRAIGNHAAAVAALAKLEDTEARRKHGLPNLAAMAAEQNRPLAVYLALYLEGLDASGTSPAYRATVQAHLTRIFAECGWHIFADVKPDALTRFLGRLRDQPQARKLVGAAKKGSRSTHPDYLSARGCSPATLNSYLRSAKSFTLWLAERFGRPSPLRSVKRYHEEVDRRRSYRVLTDEELDKLIAAADSVPRRHNSHLCGRDRAALYRVAAYTGLRASELASLTPSHFDLVGDPPTVTVEARYAKSRRLEPLPLHNHLVVFLAEWLRGRNPKANLWPGSWAEKRRQACWICRDADRAGLGGGVTFHGLRRGYITGLIRSGADIDQVRRLARHKDVKTTINNYAVSTLKQLAEALNEL